jgi:hypothetical protein
VSAVYRPGRTAEAFRADIAATGVAWRFRRDTAFMTVLAGAHAAYAKRAERIVLAAAGTEFLTAVMEQSGGCRRNDEAEHGQRRKSDGKEFFHGGTVSRKAGANGPGHRPGGGRAPMIHVNYTRRAGTENPCGGVFSR